MASEHETNILSSTIKSIGIRFLHRLEGQVVELETHLKCISELKDSNGAVKKIGAIAHQISGLAKPVGYPGLGEMAANLDSTVHLYLTGNPETGGIDKIVLETGKFINSCLKILRA